MLSELLSYMIIFKSKVFEKAESFLLSSSDRYGNIAEVVFSGALSSMLTSAR